MQQRPTDYFNRNLDFPPDGLPLHRKQEFPPPNLDQCHRYHGRIINTDGQEIVDDVVVPLNGDLSDEEDCYSSDESGNHNGNDNMGTSERTAATSPSSHAADHAYWLQRELREAIYGGVWLAQILERIPTNDGSLRWRATPEKAAIKIMDFHKIMEEDKTSAERPLQEIGAMQHLANHIALGQGIAYMEAASDMSAAQRRERAIQAMMEHHVMTPFDVLSDDSNIYLVMPFCGGGELFDALESRQRLPADEARFWFKQVLKGVESLQRAGICHRDMSLENLITTSDNVALIIDYGMTFLIPQVVDDSGRRQRCLTRPDVSCGKVSSYNNYGITEVALVCITYTIYVTFRFSVINCFKSHKQPYYASPEIVKNIEPFDGHAVDVWALGPILFMMVCGFPPWERASSTDERYVSFSAGHFAAIAEHWNLGLSSDLVDLLKRLFWANPKQRLSLQQIRNHPWMNGPEQRPPLPP